MTMQTEQDETTKDVSATLDKARKSLTETVQAILRPLTGFQNAFGTDTYFAIKRERALAEGTADNSYTPDDRTFHREIEASAALMVVSLEKAAKNIRRQLELRRGLPLPEGISPKDWPEADAFLKKADEYVKTGFWGDEFCYPVEDVKVRAEALKEEFPDIVFKVMLSKLGLLG